LPARTSYNERMNLRRHLLIRVILVGLLCWLVVSIYVVAQAGRRTAQNMSVVADRLQAMIALDVMQRLLATGSDATHPALGWFAGYFPEPLCLRYTAANDSVSEFGCPETTATVHPELLTRILAALRPAHEVLRRDISLWSRTAGVLQVELDETRLAQREWRSIQELLGLTAVALFVLAALIFWVFARLLRPTAKIVAALERLGSGGEPQPMPDFQPREFGLIADGINRLAARLAQSQRAREDLTARLFRSQETERREIAHELHEEFGQCVAALGAVGVGLRDSAVNGEPLTEADVAPLEAGIENIFNSLRGLLQRLSASPMERQGLRSAVTDLIAAWQRRLPASTRIDAEFEGLADDRPNDERTLCAYRIVQEALSNIARHAPASTRIAIGVREHDGVLLVHVLNEAAPGAKAIASAKGIAGAGATSGMGLKLLDARVRSLRGTFTVQAAAAEFTVRAALPAENA